MRKMELMLQALLADRFKLQVHAEKKELPVYALVVERPETSESSRSRLPSFAGDRRSVLNKTGVEGRFDIKRPPFLRGAATPGTLI